MKRLIIKFLIVLEIINVASFMIVRIFNEPATRLEVVRTAKPGERMNYLIAGTFNHPGTAFESLVDDMEGGITLVNFSTMSWNAMQMAGVLRKNIVQHDYAAVLYPISVGDKVARWLEWKMPMADLKVVSINPCPSPTVLKPSVRRFAKVAVPLYQAACYALGWISATPYFPSADGSLNYSMILFADQLKEVLRDDAPHEIGHTIGVIESTQDELLDNAEVDDYFGKDVPYFVVKARHADTVNKAREYNEALRQIEKTINTLS